MPLLIKKHTQRKLYKSVIFEGATLVYRPDCNAEALQEGRYTSVAPEQNHAIIIITTWSHDV